MKCIKTAENEIRRVKDKEAQKLVNEGKASYAKKTDWRKTDPEWKKRSDTLKGFEKNKKKEDERVVDLTDKKEKDNIDEEMPEIKDKKKK